MPLGIVHCELCLIMTTFKKGLIKMTVQADTEALECLHESSRLVWMDK